MSEVYQIFLDENVKLKFTLKFMEFLCAFAKCLLDSNRLRQNTQRINFTFNPTMHFNDKIKMKITLRKFLRIDLVISVNLYKISFLSLVLNIYKNILSSLKHILIRSIFG